MWKKYVYSLKIKMHNNSPSKKDYKMMFEDSLL